MALVGILCESLDAFRFFESCFFDFAFHFGYVYDGIVGGQKLFDVQKEVGMLIDLLLEPITL
jgi:hypothetical protein